MPYPTTPASAPAVEAADTRVLILTCEDCGAVREQPADEPVTYECPDPECGGWVFGAQLAEPGLRYQVARIEEAGRFRALLDALRGVRITPGERASLHNLAPFEAMAVHVTNLIRRARDYEVEQLLDGDTEGGAR